MRAAHRRGEGADTGELWRVAMELHGFGLLWIVSPPRWLEGHRGEGATLW
jgi:hypothetical protein